MDTLFQNNTYFFIFAHPDDEIYCCILMHKLIQQKKNVHAIYLTSGDAGGESDVREQEVKLSMKNISGHENNIHFIRISETQLLNNLDTGVESLELLAKQYKPDCVIAHDYEGGHEGHDAASFCASYLVTKSSITSHFVFPIYHGKPTERKGARFKPSRKNIITLNFENEDIEIKTNVLNSHTTQQAHFEKMKLDPDYSHFLFSREVFWKVIEPINYTEKPMDEVGYEYHRNGFKFTDFINAISKIKK